MWTVSPARALLLSALLVLGAQLGLAIGRPLAAFAAAPGEATPLSNEETLTYWAHAARAVPVRTQPADKSAEIARLRFDTEDGLPEVYLLLRQQVAPDGRTWVEVRVPMRPNGRTGWVPREALDRFRPVTTQLRIDRGRLRATLYRGGKPIWTARVGVGARGSPTPAGRFYVRERIRSLRGGTTYGPLAFGTSAYSRLSDWPGGGVVGIHGTNRPGLIPGRPSHGCVRLRNGAIRQLGRLMPIGTPVLIE